jgi:hypothetical protein
MKGHFKQLILIIDKVCAIIAFYAAASAEEETFLIT